MTPDLNDGCGQFFWQLSSHGTNYFIYFFFWFLEICNFLEVPRFPAWFLRMLLVCVVLQAGHSWAGGSTEAYGTGRVWVAFWQGAGEDRDVSCISQPTRQVVSSAGVRYLKNPSVCWGFFFIIVLSAISQDESSSTQNIPTIIGSFCHSLWHF